MVLDVPCLVSDLRYPVILPLDSGTTEALRRVVGPDGKNTQVRKTVRVGSDKGYITKRSQIFF